MHQRTLFQSKVGLAVALFAAVGVAMPAAAQSGGEPPAMLDAGVVRLIPGMTAEFEALQRERVAMYKSQDYKGSRQVYQTVRGNNHEYRVITPLNKYGDLDDTQQVGPDGWSDGWFSRVFRTIDNRTASIYQVRSDLSVPDPPDRTSGLVLLIISEVNYGKAAEYESVLKEIQTAYKKVNATGFGVYRSRIGSSRRVYFQDDRVAGRRRLMRGRLHDLIAALHITATGRHMASRAGSHRELAADLPRPRGPSAARDVAGRHRRD